MSPQAQHNREMSTYHGRERPRVILWHFCQIELPTPADVMTVLIPTPSGYANPGLPGKEAATVASGGVLLVQCLASGPASRQINSGGKVPYRHFRSAAKI